jgi:hypothetical protein
VRESSSEEFLHTDLAPSFGTLTKDSIKDLDEQLKIMIAGTMKTLAKVQDKTWKNVLGAMSQNELLQPDGEEIARADKLIKESSNDFKFDGGSDASIVREVGPHLSPYPPSPPFNTPLLLTGPNMVHQPHRRR